MKFTFILIHILIYFFNPFILKSDEKTVSSSPKKENTFKEKILNRKKSKFTKIHIVKVGDTIASISKLYSVDKNLIIKLNLLKNENYIYVGQNLIISNYDPNPMEVLTLKNQEREEFHIVKAGENLTEISNIYKLNSKYLIEINNLKNPDSIKVGQKLLLSKKDLINTENIQPLKENKINEFVNINKKNYGPIRIQSNRVKTLNGKKILNVTNHRDKKLILSIRCEPKELDVRIPGKKWRGWLPAKEEFEKDLINDLC